MVEDFQEIVSLQRGSSSGIAFRSRSEHVAMLSLQIALRCSDLAHITLPWKLHVQWAQRLEEELFSQGDVENAVLICQYHSSWTDRNRVSQRCSKLLAYHYAKLWWLLSLPRSKEKPSMLAQLGRLPSNMKRPCGQGMHSFRRGSSSKMDLLNVAWELSSLDIFPSLSRWWWSRLPGC